MRRRRSKGSRGTTTSSKPSLAMHSCPQLWGDVFLLKGPRHSAELVGLKASAEGRLCEGLTEPSVLLHIAEALTLMPKSSYRP